MSSIGKIGSRVFQQPGAEHSLMPRVALHPQEAHFNNSAMAAMGG